MIHIWFPSCIYFSQISGWCSFSWQTFSSCSRIYSLLCFQIFIKWMNTCWKAHERWMSIGNRAFRTNWRVSRLRAQSIRLKMVFLKELQHGWWIFRDIAWPFWVHFQVFHSFPWQFQPNFSFHWEGPAVLTGCLPKWLNFVPQVSSCSLSSLICLLKYLLRID